jgi:archaellum biogenesis ATPase FlaH
MNSDIEKVILRNIITNESFMRKVIPFIKKDYFEGVYQVLFSEIVRYVSKYNRLPNEETFRIEFKEAKVNNDEHSRSMELIPEIFEKTEVDEEWLLNSTEKWCQDRAVYNAIMESILIIDGKHQKLNKNAVPDILSKALSVCFDTNIGHDYIENADSRFEFYHEQEERIPFDLDYLNKITKGGLPNKTLNVALAGTGVGKSLFMCHHAASCLTMGYNVLYLTMEMAEERIAERIDANLMNVRLDDLESMSREKFVDRVQKIASKTQGKLIIKEYPTGQAHSNHFRALLNELKLKRSFRPDIIFIDYLNICASSRMKGMGGAINSYSYIKSIAEEMRGLAVEFDLPIVSATQTTRSGFSSNDPGLEDTSESFGLPATADLMFALISNEELQRDNQIVVKQLKNRYNDPNSNKRFCIGVDRSKMRLYDIEEETQTYTEDNGPVFDKSNTGERVFSEKLSSFKMS